MAEIKPDEISAIIRQQISVFDLTTEMEEVGTVLQVGDGIARVFGLNNVGSGELVEFENGIRAIVRHRFRCVIQSHLLSNPPQAKPSSYPAELYNSLQTEGSRVVWAAREITAAHRAINFPSGGGKPRRC